MKYSKKLVGILLAVVISAASIMGCTSTVDTSAVVLTVGDEEVAYGTVDLYARFLSAYYETYYGSYFGEDMWITEVEEGVTYQDNIKDTIMTTIQEVVVVRQHAEELGVSLTDEEVAEITAAAEEFVAANDEASLSLVSGTVEYAVEVLSLFEIDEKCRQEIIKAVDTEVSDEEAAQKKASYIYQYLTTTDDDGNSVDMTEDEIAALEAELEELIAESQDGGDLYTLAEEKGFTVLETTFDDDTSSLNSDLLAGLVALESEGDVTEIIKTDSIYYVAQLTSEFDQDATDSMKETIISERESELYSETVDAWVAETEIVVDEALWETVDFQALSITMYYEDTTTEEVTE